MHLVLHRLKCERQRLSHYAALAWRFQADRLHGAWVIWESDKVALLGRLGVLHLGNGYVLIKRKRRLQAADASFFLMGLFRSESNTVRHAGLGLKASRLLAGIFTANNVYLNRVAFCYTENRWRSTTLLRSGK